MSSIVSTLQHCMYTLAEICSDLIGLTLVTYRRLNPLQFICEGLCALYECNMLLLYVWVPECDTFSLNRKKNSNGLKCEEIDSQFFVHMSRWIMVSAEFRAGPSGLCMPCHWPAWELPWDWKRVWCGKQRDPVANADLYYLHRTCLLQTAGYLAETNGFTDTCWHKISTNTLHIYRWLIK